MTKRLLTGEEIDELLDFIVPNQMIPKDTAESIVKMNKNRLIKQLKTQLVYPEIIAELKEILKKNYFEAIIDPGTSVGILCAQSIGEKNTQSTLNTFHKAGQGDKTTTHGVPRFQELLNATKSPKNVNCKIYFNEGNETIQDLRKTIGHNLVCLTLKDISDDIQIKIKKEPEDWYDIFKILYNNNYECHENCISVFLNKKMLFKYRITIDEIAKRIEDEWEDLYCVFSSQELSRLDIFVDVSKIEFTEEQLLFVTSENSNEIYLEEVVLPILEKYVFFGIPGIENIYYTKDSDDTWFVETDGSNFRKLLGNPLIDYTRLYSNNVWDVYQSLGIEAAKQLLIIEFQQLMDGINICHTKLLVEKMTFTGSISSISRYTLRKDECGPLSKASFEESVEHMIKSGFNGDVEHCKGVSASIICGNRSKMGTGFFDMKINIKQIKDAIPVFRDENNDGIVLEKEFSNMKIQ